MGSVAGGAVGAIASSALSPNDESRGLNALVFGLGGALTGGLLFLFSHDDSEIPQSKNLSLKEKEIGAGGGKISGEYFIPQNELPGFLKERFKQAIVEEIKVPDTVSEDGALHEPHKVYRIKREAELFAKPIKEQAAIQNKKRDKK